MKKILRFKTLVGIIVAFLIGLFNLLDISTVKDNPLIYDISANSYHWMFKSLSNYTTWRIIQAFICFIYIGVSVIYLMKTSKNLKIILIIFETLIIIWGIRYFCLWYVSGFDHYPGFDPYVF